MCRQFVSSLYGDGAVGKTANRIACALALATGRGDILNGLHVFQRCKVLYLCFEDGEVELKRRICAAMKHHEIFNDDIKGYLFVRAITDHELKLVTSDNHGKTTLGPLIEALDAEIARLEIDATFLDPLIKTHGCEENNNTAMDLVSEILTDLAVRHNMALDIPHHVRKGPPDPGNADAGRGASAIKDGGRLIYTQTPMSPEEAELYSVSEEERLSLVRVDQGKVNIVRRTGKPQWFRIVSVNLGNTGISSLYRNGDDVQTIEAWNAPNPQDLQKTQIVDIFTKIRKGPCEGERYSPEASSNDWAGTVIKTVADKSERAAALILKTWIDRDVLLKDKYPSPRHGRRNNRVWGLWVNEAKAREILESLYHPPEPEPELASDEFDDEAEIETPTAEDAPTVDPEPPPAAKPAGVKLTDLEQIAFDELVQALTAAGTPSIPLETWRECAITGRFGVAGNPQATFSRVSASLIKKKLVTLTDGLVGLVE
jgi:hypothetical protein